MPPGSMSASPQEPSPSSLFLHLGLLTTVSGVLLTGCYGAAPPRPAPVALPDVEAGSPLVVDSRSSTTYENVQRESQTCPQGHVPGSQACIKTTYTVKEPVTRTKTTATYGDTPLSYGQFLVLTDPQYDEKLVTLEDHSEACQEANVPRYIGMGLMIGGALAYGFSGGNKAATTVGAIGILGGAGSYTAGYFAFGGNRCVEAAHLHRQVNHARHSGTTAVSGSATANEMQAVADQFNRRAFSGEASAQR